MFIRTEEGTPQFAVTDPSADDRHVEVPALGQFIDNYLDAFGYPDGVIRRLASAFLQADDVNEFAILMEGSCFSLVELSFLYHYIHVSNRNPSRLRENIYLI